MGEGTKVLCPRCGEMNRDGDRVCWACGHSLSLADDVCCVRGYVAQKQYSEALALLRPWLMSHPEDADAFELAGAAYLGMGMFPAAAEAAAQVVRLRPASARAWSNWGVVLRKLGQLAKAREAQERALKLDPNHQHAHIELQKLVLAEMQAARQQPAVTPPDSPGMAATLPSQAPIPLEGLHYAAREAQQAPVVPPLQPVPVYTVPDDGIENTSGTRSSIPLEVTRMGWCSGGLSLTWIRGLVNHVYASLIILLVPVAAPVVAMWLGLKKHEEARRNRRFDSFFEFKQAMEQWNCWGRVLFWLQVAAGILLAGWIASEV